MIFTDRFPRKGPRDRYGNAARAVTDPSGATVAGATVLLTGQMANRMTSRQEKDGSYQAPGLAPGNYIVKVVAEGFGQFTAANYCSESGPDTDAAIALSWKNRKLKFMWMTLRRN